MFALFCCIAFLVSLPSEPAVSIDDSHITRDTVIFLEINGDVGQRIGELVSPSKNRQPNGFHIQAVTRVSHCLDNGKFEIEYHFTDQIGDSKKPIMITVNAEVDANSLVKINREDGTHVFGLKLNKMDDVRLRRWVLDHEVVE